MKNNNLTQAIANYERSIKILEEINSKLGWLVESKEIKSGTDEALKMHSAYLQQAKEDSSNAS